MNLKKLQRALAMVLAATMVSSVAVFAEDDSEPTFDSVGQKTEKNFYLLGEYIPEEAFGGTETQKDTATPKERETLSKLLAFGIIEDTTGWDYSTTKELTRGKFIELVIRSLDLKPSNTNSSYFYDVPSTHECAAYINCAAELGIVSGDGGMFNPDNNVTYQEAVTMLVRALGFEPIANLSGGYAMGYIQKAKQVGLLDGISVPAFESAAQKGALYSMVVNMLSSTYAIKYDTNSIEVLDDSKPILERLHGIKVGKGLVTAVGASNILGQTEYASNRVIIDGTMYNGNYVDVIPMLGYYAEFYYDKDTSDLVFISKDDTKNETLVLKDYEISDFANNE